MFSLYLNDIVHFVSQYPRCPYSAPTLATLKTPILLFADDTTETPPELQQLLLRFEECYSCRGLEMNAAKAKCVF